MAFEFEIKEHVGVISEKKSGWKKELTVTSFNGRPAKYDLREWAPDYETMGKGITFTREELVDLYELLKKRFGEYDSIRFEKSGLQVEDILRIVDEV